MEIFLPKPARLLAKTMQDNPGSYLRFHRKSLSAARQYYRLMSKDRSPIRNFRLSDAKRLTNLGLLIQSGESEFYLKDDLTLLDKPKRKKDIKQPT